MAHKYSDGEAALIGNTTCRRPSILPLPDEVVAQIKSSTTIVSLNGVVLELLKNALDARATRVDATVDWARGGCIVEDDGLGIAPLDFREGGCLGKIYCTSKHNSQEQRLGRNGTFLASLAAMSLLTIASHHHGYRSHNSMTLHHAKIVERQLPVPPQYEIKHKNHGTRVTVRNLFGNLPVRVKQRAITTEQEPEHDRIREALKRDVTGLLLSWRHKVSVIIRGTDDTIILNTNGLKNHQGADARQPSPEDFRFTLSVLTRAGYVFIDEWNSWVAASASTSNISIKGAISTEPAPTKRVQFLSLGTYPLSPENGHNELYDEINRLFNSSSFGTVENDADLDDREKIRRQNDGRFKSDGYTNRQLRGRKGVDRYPMFYLRISLRNGCSETHFLDQEANIQAVIGVLDALIMQWLEAHHFCLRNSRTNLQSELILPASDVDLSAKSSADQLHIGQPRRISRDDSAPTSVRDQSSKRKRAGPKANNAMTRAAQSRHFTQWSRIKSSKPEFYDQIWKSGKTSNKNAHKIATNNHLYPTTSETSHMHRSSPDRSTISELGSTLSRHSSTPPQSGEIVKDSTMSVGSSSDSHTDQVDGIITWIDPSTKRTHHLNARTGCAVFRGSKSDSSFTSGSSLLNEAKTSMRLKPRSKMPMETPFLDGLLDTWNNPIFRPTQMPIPQLSVPEYGLTQRRSNHLHCSHSNIEKGISKSSLSGNRRLSKDSLRSSQVIAQVDKKFVLVQMHNHYCPEGSQDLDSRILVLIDQHAADERIRVESLLAQLCTPLSTTDSLSGYRSKLGHTSRVAATLLDKALQFLISAQECDLLVAFAGQFALWGILYDIQTGNDSSTSRSVAAGKSQAHISVTVLPPSISERCKADPELLISFIRAAVWKYAEGPHHSSAPSPQIPEDSNNNAIPAWIHQLSNCPHGLMDMINSRACRSAIMFNDELGIEECKELVLKLSTCVFPFTCAHGRPSMVPLVDFEDSNTAGGLELDTDISMSSKNNDFASAWKVWTRK